MESARLTPLTLMLLYLMVGISALLPRIVDLGIFITHDEAEFWLDRSHAFLRAIQHHDYAATAITTHPGVTTMWLGSTGILLRQTLFEWGILQRDPFPTVLALMQLPVALTHVAGILVGYGLLRRLLPAMAAFLAAMLWALDPFIIGYSRLLHVDALAGTFATLSLLAACNYWYSPHSSPSSYTEHEVLGYAASFWHTRLPFLLLSGLCAGLAALSKSPALALVPVIGLVAFTASRSAGNHPARTPHPDDTPHVSLYMLHYPLFSLLLWCAVAALTVIIVWPAVWADPHEVYRLLRIGVENEGAQPHMTGNFFLGERNDAPGPLFYPVALALRMTPWTLAGVLLLALRLVPKLRIPTLSQAKRLPDARTLAALAGFVILFIAAMSIFPKKFNRYLVLVFPMVDILAAVGLAWYRGRGLGVGGRGSGVGGQGSGVRGRGLGVSAVLVAVVCGAAILNAVWYHPYSIAYFNQALGGAQAGARTFTTGWGEGLEQVAAWLNEQPDSTGVLTISRMITSLNPYMDKGVQAFFPSEGQLRESAGYVVVYINEVQGGPPLPPFDRFYGHAVPLHVVNIHGVEYAWIYQVPPPVEHSIQADFGTALSLRGFAVEGEATAGQQMLFKLSWAVHRPLDENYWLFAHVIDADGQPYTQVDLPYETSTWQPGRFLTSDLLIPLPADLPTGRYRILVGLYDPQSGQRLPLSVPPQRDQSDLIDQSINQPDALLLTEVVVE